MAKHRVKVNFGMQMAIATKASGATTKPMDMECICTLMELVTSAPGKTTFNTAKAKRPGLMAVPLKVTTSMVRKRVVAPTYGLMAPVSAADGMKTKLMGMVFTSGRMVANLKVPGRTIICMVKDFTHGQMAEATRAITKMTKSTEMEFIHGATADSIAANG